MTHEKHFWGTLLHCGDLYAVVSLLANERSVRANRKQKKGGFQPTDP